MNNVQQEHERLLIGDLLLDVAQRSVARNGVQIEMPKLSLRMLQALAAAAPGMLTHDELIGQVWPGRVITPETLTQRVKLLRQALGDDARDPRYVGLVRGEGYRLLVQVQPLSAAERRPARQFLDEVLRRNIPAVALVYAAAAWAVSLGIEPLGDALPGMPRSLPAAVAIALILGLPISVLLAWRVGGVRRIATQWETSAEGRLSAAAALLLVVCATAGLALAVFPERETWPNDIAVLPFENASGDPANDAFSEGVSGELRDQLGRIPGLRVVARASSMIFRGQAIDLPAIANQLAADTVITGIVRTSQSALSIHVELVDGRTGTQIWSESYEADSARLLGLQERLHADVIARIAPQVPARTAAARFPTTSEAANSLMMIADKYYRDVLDQPVLNARLLGAAIAAYRRAVNEDPQSALLRSRLAAALLYSGDHEAAELQIRAALRLDENLSHVQHTQGLFMLARHQDGVGERLMRAVELDENNVEALGDYGLYLWANTDVPAARTYLERALELDPMSIGRYEVLGNFYGTAGFFDEAFALIETVPRLNGAAADLFVAQIHELSGDLDMAIAWARRAQEGDPAFADARWKLAELYTRIGDLETARQLESKPSVSALYFSRNYEEMIDLAAENYFEDASALWLFATAQANLATDRYETVISLLSNYGLPDHLERDSATLSEFEAGISLADAYKQSGNIGEGVRIADLLYESFVRWRDQHPGTWHPYINLACIHSIRGERQLALDALESMMERRGMPWYPRVRDQACFRVDLKDEPRYEAVLTRLLERKAELRARLPATLAAFRSEEFRTNATR